MTFPGFTNEDFDAYQPHKWQSNVFNLERLQVKQKLSQLGKQLEGAMVARDGSPLALEISAEHPELWNQRTVDCQHLFFSRNAAARSELDGIISRERSMASLIEDPSPLRQHIFVGLRIDQHELEIALKLHSDAAVDRDNLVRKLADHHQRERLLARLHELPEPFTCGIAGQELVPAGEVDGEQLAAFGDALAMADSWLAVRRVFPRDDVTLADGEAFAQLCSESLRALLPLLHEIAWSRDNDFLSMKQTLREKRTKERQKGLQKDDRVRVLAGVFAGKVGVIQSVDAKGGVKVMLGAMPIKLSSEDIQKVGE